MLKQIIVEKYDFVHGTTDNDEETNMYDMHISKGQFSQYPLEANAEDEDYFVNDNYLKDSPHASQKKACDCRISCRRNMQSRYSCEHI